MIKNIISWLFEFKRFECDYENGELGYGEPAGVRDRLKKVDELIYDAADYNRLLERTLYKTSAYAMQAPSKKNIEKLTKSVSKLKWNF